MEGLGGVPMVTREDLAYVVNRTEMFGAEELEGMI